MPYYSKLGQIPGKRHIQFRRPDGALYSEEVFGTEGFVGPTSTLYHIHPPTQVTGWKTLYSTKPEYSDHSIVPASSSDRTWRSAGMSNSSCRQVRHDSTRMGKSS